MSWKIKKPLGHCSSCQRELQDQEPHFSALRISGEEISREDHCIECWHKAEVPSDAIFWKTKHYVSPQKKRAIDFEALREIFLQLCEKKEPAQEALHYLVALLLVRKKILKIRELRQSEKGDLVVVGFPRVKESFELSVPDLSAERLEALKSDLKALFGEDDGLSTPAVVQPESSPTPSL